MPTRSSKREDAKQTAARIPRAMGSKGLSNHAMWTLAVAVVVPIASGRALAQNWTAVSLHDNTMFQSSAYATYGDLIGGYGAIGGHSRAILWNLGTSAWSDLTPSGFTGGEVRAAFGAWQGGGVATDDLAHAALWSGSVNTFVDLHPSSNPYISELLGMDLQQQVGYARPTLGSPYHQAALWRGTGSSYVNLHPSGVVESQAVSVSDGQQGGYFRVTGSSGYHAAIWSGTAQSMKDLHPAGAIESQILGVAPGQQVGWSGAPVTRAAMWHGTAESYIDMGPPGSGVSQINATCGTAQAGYANFAGTISAVVWFGSPNDFVRLDGFMPAGYSGSVATGISQVDGLYYVSGYAHSPTGRIEAFAWHGVPTPGTLGALVCAGFVVCRRRR